MGKLYVGTLRQRWIQFRVLHIRPRWNQLRRRFDSVAVEFGGKHEYHHSEFPHPLVTIDYDSEGHLMGVEVQGSNLKARRS